MFVSAGIDLKFHNYPVDLSNLIYKPLQQTNIKSLSWSKDNCFLTFVNENAKPEIISLKDLNNIKSVHTISTVTGASAICFQKNTKRYIGIGTNNGQIALYDTKNKSINKLFENAPCSINFLDFNVVDKQMAVSCVNGSVLLYDTKKTNICEIYNISNASHSTTMQFHPRERHLLAIGTEDGSLTEWDVGAGQNVFDAQIHTAPVTGLALVENTNFFVSVGSDHKFCIHDVNMGESVFRSNLPHPLTAVDVGPNNFTVAIGNIFGNIYVYDLRQLMVPISVTKPHNTKINKVVFQNKVIDNADGNFSEINSGCCYPIQEVAKHETKYPKQDVNENEMQCELTAPCLVRCGGENVSNYIKHTNHDTEHTSSMQSIKEEVTNSIYKSTEELRVHLMQQISSLHNVIVNEFYTLEDQMEEKWDILNSVIAAKDIQNKTD